jgi:hypothetical protein
MNNNAKYVYYLEVYTADSFEPVAEYSGSAPDLLQLTTGDEFVTKFGNADGLEYGVSISGPRTRWAPEGYYGCHSYPDLGRLVHFLEKEVSYGD